ncbi:dehydrogenase/reductase SDR family member FEY-like [Malus sylvestris]|uniref:dehydrogenase/reductase SDR family member FEY-like n=1 Tax=Malus sylvestris TaxID=3752 RepID=UPI0021ACCAC9|nr:dehydrogenase/reductase SDR family member FEY-like [Malus sylvestris]
MGLGGTRSDYTPPYEFLTKNSNFGRTRKHGEKTARIPNVLLVLISARIPNVPRPARRSSSILPCFLVVVLLTLIDESFSLVPNPMPLPPINDLTCIVTGSTSGIGREIARQLAESGAYVVMAVRNTKAANELIQKWQNEWSGMGLPLNIEVMELDLLSLDSVVRFAEAWNARLGPLHVLINNAGIFSIGEPQKFSKDGYEEHLQVNHLAPALLSVLLLPSLIRGSPSRIVNLNSVMHYVGFVDTEDMNVVSRKRKYTSLVGYSSSKLAHIMFSSVLHKRLPAESGISVVCVSPGIVQTNVAKDLPRIVQAAYHLVPYLLQHSLLCWRPS